MLGSHLLRKWRAERGLSQVEAARILGIPQNRVSHYETGQRGPGLPIAFRIERNSGGAIPASSWAVPGPSEVTEPEATKQAS